MEIHELQQLLSEMSLQEKIGQMVQLTGAYFDKEAVLTGVVGEQLPPEWIIQYAGSVLGVCLLYTSPSPRDRQKSRMPSSA